jgi:hypothetical protein
MFLYTGLGWLKSVNRKSKFSRHDRRRNHTPEARFVPRLEALECRALPSTLTVLNNADSGDGSLRAMLALASSGDTITFDPSLAGQTMTLISGELAIDKSVDIEGLGADQLTVSGNDASRVFHITGSGLTVTIADLAIVHGRASRGGAIDNAGSRLSLLDCTLSDNQAVGATGGDGKGGAIVNEGSAVLLVSHSTLTHNLVIGGPADASGNAGGAIGGGIANVGATSTAAVSHSTITDNQAVGGDGGAGGKAGNAWGAGISNENGATLTLSHSTVTHNLTKGGHRGDNSFGNGFGFGGGLENEFGATVTVTNSTFTANQAVGGAGDAGVSGGNGVGGGILNGFSSIVNVSDCTFTDNQAVGGAGGSGAVGGIAGGGGINSGAASRLVVTHSTFTHNQAIGGAGGTGANGGLGHAGALENNSIISAGQTTLSLSDSTLTNNLAVGGAAGAGGIGGNGIGGGIDNNTNQGLPASATVSNCRVTDNQAVGGVGSDGANGGDGLGGGINNAAGATLVVTGSTITGNQALGGDGTTAGQGIGGGLYLADGRKVSVKDTTIKDNHASTSDDNVFEVEPGPATHFGISAPAHVTSSMAFDVTVTALDAFAHTAVGYRGTVTFSSSDTDPGVVLPTDYTFTTDDGGVHAFPSGFTLVTPGDQMLTATDMGDNTITSSAIVTVDPGPAAPPGGGARDPDQPAPFRGRYAFADNVLVENRATTSDGQRVGRGPYLVHSGTASIEDTTSGDDVFGDFPPDQAEKR